MSKGEQRRVEFVDVTRHVAIASRDRGLAQIDGGLGRTARVLRVVVERFLPDGAGERDRQAAAGVHVAEQRARQRGARLHTGVPGFEDRGHVLRRPGNRQRPRVEEHQRHGLARCDHRFQQLLLATLEIQMCA